MDVSARLDGAELKVESKVPGGEFDTVYASGRKVIPANTKISVWKATDAMTPATEFDFVELVNKSASRTLQVNLFVDSGGAAPIGITLFISPDSSIRIPGATYNGSIAGAVSSIANQAASNDTWDHIEFYNPAGGTGEGEILLLAERV